MAKYKAELPLELIEQFTALAEGGSDRMLAEMVEAGAEVAISNIKANMAKSFDDSAELAKCLVKTKLYKTQSDDGVNKKVAFYGYFTNKQGKTVPAPLVVQAREYGTSKGEAKKPFIRKSFKKAQITQAMQKVQDRYLNNE